MSPEFLALLEDGKQLGRWFTLLPVCLGFLGLYYSAAKSKKVIAFLYITLLAAASVVIPTLLAAAWWGELTDVGKSDEETAWIYNHDGGGLLVGPLYATILASIFWLIAVLILSVRVVIALIRKLQRSESNIDPKESS